MARTANWILTFDDGPLPADKRNWNNDEGELLAPLAGILQTLATFGPSPITAVFYLRGPQFPWIDLGLPVPSDAIFEAGLRMIVDAGHAAAVHCYSHNPDLWRRIFPDKERLLADLDTAVEYFSQFGSPLSPAVRAPYGGFGDSVDRWVGKWAAQRGYAYHEWALDTADWLHHPDTFPQLFVDEPRAHRDYIHLQLAIHAPAKIGSAARQSDVLMHVSERTDQHLSDYLQKLVDISKFWGARPAFEVPAAYFNGA